MSNAEQLRDQAREKAMKNARRRAELFARSANAELGQVIQIQDGLTMEKAKEISKDIRDSKLKVQAPGNARCTSTGCACTRSWTAIGIAATPWIPPTWATAIV